MIDDLSPIRQLDDQIMVKENHLFKPKAAYRMYQGGWGGRNEKLEGENHPNGVLFNYFIENEKDTVKLSITEMDGTEIITFSNQSKKNGEKLKVETGGNRFIWNLRYPGFTTFPEWFSTLRRIWAQKQFPGPTKQLCREWYGDYPGL